MDTVQITETPEAIHVLLMASMEVAMVQAFYRQVTPLLAQPTALVMDASQVLRIDSAALQTLACFCRSAHERGIPLHWSAVSPALQQTAQQLGLDRLLFEQA